MTRAALCLAAFYLAGCAHSPGWTVSNPGDRYGWSAPRMCYSLCRKPAGLIRVGVSF